MAAESEESVDALDSYRQFFALEPDVLVLSVAMLVFSLAFQMTTRYVPEYLFTLGAGAGIVGLYGSPATSSPPSTRTPVAPSPTASVRAWRSPRSPWSPRSDSWCGRPLLAPRPDLPVVSLAGIEVGGTVGPWVWVFLGLLLTQAWKSFGLGATFAIVKQSVAPDRLAMGFASTEIFRRVGFLLGPAIAAVVLAVYEFQVGFQYVLLLAAGFAAVATVAQHALYDVDERSSSGNQNSKSSDDASEDTVGDSFEGLDTVRRDFRNLPDAAPVARR